MSGQEWNGHERRSMNHDFAMFSARLETLHSDVAEIKGAMRELTAAITKLALIEERISVTAGAQERAFDAIKEVENRVAALELRVPIDDNYNKWIDRGITAVVGAALMFVWDKVTR